MGSFIFICRTSYYNLSSRKITQKKSSVIFQLFNTRWKNDNRLDREPLQA